MAATDVTRMGFDQYMTHRGYGYEAYDLVGSILTAQYWRVALPTDKSVYLGARIISGDAGPIFYSIYPDAVVDTIGAPMHIENRRVGGKASGIEINRCTLSGDPGTEVVKAIARGSGGGAGVRRAGVAGPSSVQVYPPGGTVIVGIRVEAEVANVELRYEWVEGDPLEVIDA